MECIDNLTLTSRAGQDYPKEIQEKLKGWQAKTEAQKEVVVMSGGKLPYLTIIHMPIEGYTGPKELAGDKHKMITAVEKGIDRANELWCQRIVMCADGLRSAKPSETTTPKGPGATPNQTTPGFQMLANRIGLGETRFVATPPRGFTLKKTPTGGADGSCQPRRTEGDLERSLMAEILLPRFSPTSLTPSERLQIQQEDGASAENALGTDQVSPDGSDSDANGSKPSQG